MRHHDSTYSLDSLDAIDSIDGIDDFNVTQSLSDDAAIAACINDVISSGNQTLIIEALKYVIKVKGVAVIAEVAGLTQEGTIKPCARRASHGLKPWPPCSTRLA